MSFDLAELDGETLAEAGVAMPIIHARSRMAMKNDDGSTVSIMLRGRHSEAFRNTLRQIQVTRSEQQARGASPDPDAKEKEDIAFLIACTTDWTLQTLDGKPFPCTASNIRLLWNDNRFRWLREVAISFVLTDANFLAPSSTISGGLLATVSPLPDLSPATAAVSALPSKAIA